MSDGNHSSMKNWDYRTLSVAYGSHSYPSPPSREPWHIHQMDPSQSARSEPLNPGIISGSQDPEEPNNSSPESQGAPVPIHLQDPEQPDPAPEDSIPSLFPIHQNAPEGHEKEQETNLPKPNLRTLIKQPLQHPNQPRPALPREVLQAHQRESTPSPTPSTTAPRSAPQAARSARALYVTSARLATYYSS